MVTWCLGLGVRSRSWVLPRWRNFLHWQVSISDWVVNFVTTKKIVIVELQSTSRKDRIHCRVTRCSSSKVHQCNQPWPVRCGRTTAHLLTPRLLDDSPADDCMLCIPATSAPHTSHLPREALSWDIILQRWTMISQKCWCTCTTMLVNRSHLLCW